MSITQLQLLTPICIPLPTEHHQHHNGLSYPGYKSHSPRNTTQCKTACVTKNITKLLYFEKPARILISDTSFVFRSLHCFTFLTVGFSRVAKHSLWTFHIRVSPSPSRKCERFSSEPQSIKASNFKSGKKKMQWKPTCSALCVLDSTLASIFTS